MELPENYRRLEAALRSPSAYRDWCQDRMHNALSDPGRDVPLKELARRGDDPNPLVRCPCGCHQSFTAKVQAGTQ